MTALRKIVNSNTLKNVFDLPPDYQNKKVEIVIYPVDEKEIPHLTMKQIEEWAKVPEIKILTGALKAANLPTDISIDDIRKERLANKYQV